MFKKIFFLLLIAKFAFPLNGTAQLTAEQLTCDYRVNPLGIDNTSPMLSWKLVSTGRNVMQAAYEIRVSTDERALVKGSSLVWNTGKVASGQSVLVAYRGQAVGPGKKYYWQVRVWDNQQHVSPWSTVNTWETGLLSPSDWTAAWIEAHDTTGGKVSPAPMFRKNFALSRAVKSARLYITAHGLYEAYLNGERIGEDYFRPGWTSYANRLQYQVYDVTALLKKGNNAAGAIIGDGWYRGNIGFNNSRNRYGKEAGLLFQLEVTYADGSNEKIVSDNSWKSSVSGPVLTSDVYNGETYDARKELADWTKANFSDASWQAVRVVNDSKNNLTAQQGPSVTKHEQFKPIKIFTTPNGELVADFGQNLTGWVQLHVNGKPGDSVVLQHAEVLDKAGNFYTDNLRGAKQETKYFLKGNGTEVLEPHFTFQGFRYIRIKGFSYMPDSNSFTAIAMYSDMKPSGDFTCSNALINQLQHNIQWGQKGNFLDVPTDCPQRDERLGWTGDAQVFFNTAAYNMNVAGFFSKWLLDIIADQDASGNVPAVIPDCLRAFPKGSAGWGDVATIIPWNYYVAYGDTALLRRQYASMKAWVEHLHAISKNNLWNSGSHYGDWLFYSPDDDNDGRAAITDKFLIAQTFYAYSTQNLLNAAKVLGNEADVKKYTVLLDSVKQAFLHEYVTPSGRLVSSTQTAYVLALNFDLLPENMRADAAKRLVDNIAAYRDHLTTGFLGTPYLCHVLTRFGYTDVAYKLLLQETFPSWLYPVKRGATTIWERWNGIKTDGSFQNAGMNSFNHYAYGAIGDWMYKVVAGISPDKQQPGYKYIVIAPQPGGGLTNAGATYQSLYGEVKSSWKTADGKLSVDITIPCNTSALVTLPGAPDAVNDGNMKRIGKDLQTTLGSGIYHFEYAYAR
ncbi:MAG: glycoside hydrolase family 78 protein [Chitinophagaceae bacterium]